MLACNFGKLEDEIDLINKSEAKWFHLDVMDGIFVPNISFGTPIMKVFKKHSKKTMDEINSALGIYFFLFQK